MELYSQGPFTPYIKNEKKRGILLVSLHTVRKLTKKTMPPGIEFTVQKRYPRHREVEDITSHGFTNGIR